MRLALFCHSLVSDWNHGNAHFLRGVVEEMQFEGHEVRVFEPHDAWSKVHLIQQHGRQAVDDFHTAYPRLNSIEYRLDDLDLDRMLDGVDAVMVHEWNDPQLVAAIGQHRSKRERYCLLFHDTHHRSVTAPEQMRQYDLRHYDGVLAFGAVIRDIYLKQGWTQQAWTWHEAADIRFFHPRERQDQGDLVWIGNWGDGERTAELQEFLLKPIKELKLRARVHGVRYPQEGIDAVIAAGAEYHGWLPNYRAPEVFAGFKATVHVPRKPYRENLPGIPTIRVFEALASGIPLVTAPWHDCEYLFRAGRDYLQARDGEHMTQLLREILSQPTLATELAESGRQTIVERHTCRHRADELLSILDELGVHTKRTLKRNQGQAKPIRI